MIVKVKLSADPERAVTIPFTKANQGGASSDDDSGVPSSVTFNRGNTEKTFALTATLDTEEDNGESVNMGFGAMPAGVSPGPDSTTTISITDDDNPGPTWSATLTVGTDNTTVPAGTGYSEFGAETQGTLSNNRFTGESKTVEVQLLAHISGGLYLGLSRDISYDFTLTIGENELVASESSIPITRAQGGYWWSEPAIQWSLGDTAEVSITLSDEELVERGRAPPAAYVKNLPQVHDGTEPFTFELYFTEQFPMRFKSLRDHAIQATGSNIKKPKRLSKGSSRIWLITVQPNSKSDVTITLDTGENCEEAHAICTRDDRHLHNEPTMTVPGPVRQGRALDGVDNLTNATGTFDSKENAEGNNLPDRAPAGPSHSGDEPPGPAVGYPTRGTVRFTGSTG